jgi:uncharacterized membrane protein
VGTNLWQLAQGRGTATQIKGAEIMETVLSFVMLAMLGIAIFFIVIYAVIAFLLDSWEIK